MRKSCKGLPSSSLSLDSRIGSKWRQYLMKQRLRLFTPNLQMKISLLPKKVWMITRPNWSGKTFNEHKSRRHLAGGSESDTWLGAGRIAPRVGFRSASQMSPRFMFIERLPAPIWPCNHPYLLRQERDLHLQIRCKEP